MKIDKDLERQLDTNNHGVYTEPFKWYWITHSESGGDKPVLAHRIRNGWEAWNRKFATYNQFVTSAKLATQDDLVKAGIAV